MNGQFLHCSRTNSCLNNNNNNNSSSSSSSNNSSTNHNNAIQSNLSNQFLNYPISLNANQVSNWYAPNNNPLFFQKMDPIFDNKYEYDSINYFIDLGLFLATFICIVVTFYFYPNTISYTSGSIQTFYTNLRTDGVRYECSIGGSTIKNAECQIIQGINIMLTYTVGGIMEYTASIFQSKNMWEVLSKIATVICISQVILWNTCIYAYYIARWIHFLIHKFFYNFVFYWYNLRNKLFKNNDNNIIYQNQETVQSRKNNNNNDNNNDNDSRQSSNIHYGLNNNAPIKKLITPTKKEIENLMKLHN